MSDRLKTLADALEWALGRISDRGEYWDRANEILATMSSPAAKVGTEDADAQAKALTYEEIAAAGLGLEYVHSVLRWTACGYVHTPERIASLHTSYRIVDRIINAKAAPPPPDAMAPAAPVAAVGEAVAWVIRGTAALGNEGEILSLACQSARPSGDPRWEPLYAAPQPRSSPLTDEIVNSMWLEIGGASVFQSAHNFARAIEAAHGIRGEHD